MSYGSASWTRLAGAAQGTFLDDLTTPNVGGWPKELDIVRITNITVYSGWIIDSVRITYLLTNGKTVTAVHGGPGGGVSLNQDIAANQKVVAVYGRRLNSASEFGNNSIVQLTFMVAAQGKTSADSATVTAYGTSGSWVSTHANTQFDFEWALAGAQSYTAQPSGKTIPYLQGIGFSEVLAQHGPPV